MANDVYSIIATVQLREQRRRQLSVLIQLSLPLSAFSVPAILWAWYPTWTLLTCIPPIGIVILFLVRSKRPRIAVSSEEASEIIDLSLATKERVRTFAILSQSAAAPDLVRGAFIAQQIQARLPETFAPKDLVSLKLSRSQQYTLVAALIFLIVSLSLYLLRPLSHLEEIANSIQAIVEAHPEIPDQVKLAAQDAIQDLSSSDLDGARDSLQRAHDEISLAIRKSSASKSKERTIPNVTLPPQERSQRQEPPEEKKKEQSSQEKTESPEKPQSDPDNGSSAKKEDQKRAEDSKQPNENASKKGSSNGAGESKEEKGEKPQNEESTKEGGSQDGESKEPKDGEGQGAGSSGSGPGSQGENQQAQSNSKGPAGSGKGGQGEGEGEGEGSQKTSGSSQPQSGSQKEGQQQTDGSQGGKSGIEQLQNAIAKAEQEVKAEQQKDSSQKEGSQGDKGEGDGDKENTSGRKGSSAGKDNAASPKGGDNEGEKEAQKKNAGGSPQQKDSKGNDQQSSSGKTSEPEADPNRGDSGNAGAQKDEKREEKHPPESDSKEDGVGDRSSMPDRSAKAVSEQDGPGAGGDGPNPLRGVKESQIEGKDESFDARFTGSEATLEENKSPANSKTSLDDVLLAKPQGSVHKGKQPIPLEYKELLDE